MQIIFLFITTFFKFTVYHWRYAVVLARLLLADSVYLSIMRVHRHLERVLAVIGLDGVDLFLLVVDEKFHVGVECTYLRQLDLQCSNLVDVLLCRVLEVLDVSVPHTHALLRLD